MGQRIKKIERKIKIKERKKRKKNNIIKEVEVEKGKSVENINITII